MLLYTPESVYEMDHAALAVDGFSEPELMQRAGERVWREIDARWSGLHRITVFAGAGNNGGDAFVARVISAIYGNKVVACVRPGRDKALAVS